MHFLTPGELASIILYLLSSSKHFSPPHIDHVPHRQKAVPERGHFTLLQLSGRLEQTRNSAPCPGLHLPGCEPQHQHHQETWPQMRGVCTICPFGFLFCEPGILLVVKFKKGLSLTLQHLNFSKYF